MLRLNKKVPVKVKAPQQFYVAAKGLDLLLSFPHTSKYSFLFEKSKYDR